MIKGKKAGLWLASLALLELFALPAKAASSTISLDPTKPESYWLAGGSATRVPLIPKKGLKGLPQGSVGWFDFGFEQPESGWEEVEIEGVPNVGAVEFMLDGPHKQEATRGTFRPREWIWVEKGRHRLRVLVSKWTGLPTDVTKLVIKRIAPTSQAAFRLEQNWDRPVTRTNSCAPLNITAGGGKTAAHMLLFFTRDGKEVRQESLTIPPSPAPKLYRIDPPCKEEGRYEVKILMGGGPLQGTLEGHAVYTAIDTSAKKAAFRKGKLAVEIDASKRLPDYASDSTHVAHSAAGTYRESGTRGALRYSRRQTQTQPSWFAYKIEGLKKGHPYLFEIEYPDDERRVFIAALRMAGESSYPVSLGQETGGIWPVSNALVQRSAIVWPNAQAARAVILNYHDGEKAAISKIRLYEIEETIKPSPPHREKDETRDVAFYSEEGTNLKMLVGGTDKAEVGLKEIDRYIRLVKTSGGTLIAPAVLVYGTEAYPSRYNLSFRQEGEDVVEELLLKAEGYGLKVTPELHPRADELIWPAQTKKDFEERLSLSKEGKDSFGEPGHFARPPYYNALDPKVRAWYAGMIEEFAKRYKNDRAFTGIQLRVSTWQNAGLNTLVSLDWGYNAENVARFFKEERLTPPPYLSLKGNSPEEVKTRAAFLLSHVRAQWISWRCKMTKDLMQELVARVRRVRPDLQVRLFFVSLSNDVQPNDDALKEMGIDLTLLKSIKGLVLVDGRFQHGAKESALSWQKQAEEGPLDPERGAALFARAESGPETLYPMHYLEIPGGVATAEQLGWVANKSKEPWISAASEPPDRLRLARYAALLSRTDAVMIGDGGNGYVFPNEALKNFYAVFTSLPRERFTRQKSDSAALYIGQNSEGTFALNLSSAPCKAELPANGGALLKKGPPPLAQERESFTVEPYELRYFKSSFSKRSSVQ